MGKGDVKSRRGKIWRGSFGGSRPRKASGGNSAPVVSAEAPKAPKSKAPSKSKKA